MEQLQETPVTQPTPEVKPPKLKKKRKWVKRLIAAVVVIAAAALLLRGCLGGGGSSLAAGTYLPSTVSYQDLTITVSGSGTIEPIHSYRVTTLIQGEVIEAPFEEGQEVEEGQLLFRIDSSDVENSIQQAQLALQQAQLSYNQLLRDQQTDLKDRTIRATESGVITELYVEQGDNITAGAPIADILDRDHMKLTVPFHSADAAGFYVGQSATVMVDGTMESVTGTVDSIAATDSVGAGGTLVRNVTIVVDNPGALSDTTTGTASIGSATCAASAAFQYGASKQVLAKASGELETLSVKEGDRVNKDQVLGTIAQTDMETQIENARLNVENAQLSLERMQDQLEDYTITSTISGTVIEKNYEAGDKIDATTASAGSVTYPAVIYDMSALTFEMDIHELDISKIQVGQKVEFTSDALEDMVFTGTVDKVNINGTTSNGRTTYPVTILVDDVPEDLYPGMNVSAEIIVEEAGSALCIPVDYVARGNTVLVALEGCLDENGVVVDPSKIEQRQVTLGRSNSTYIEVLDGLNEGDIVLLESQASDLMSAMMGV